MLHLRLPYFYNLPVALMLVFYVINKLEKVFFAFFPDTSPGYDSGSSEVIFYIKILLICLPALTAATHFFMGFYYRHDLNVRETLYILSVVHALSYLLPAFLF